MTCREMYVRLPAYVDGTLAGEERIAFDAHLGGCPPCRGYLGTFRMALRLGRDPSRTDGDDAIRALPVEVLGAIRDARRRRF